MRKLVLFLSLTLAACETGVPCENDQECGEGAFCGTDPYNSQPICVQGCLEDADCGDFEACHHGGCVVLEQEIQFSSSIKRIPGRSRRRSRQPQPKDGVHYANLPAENPSYERVVYSRPPVYAGNAGEEQDHPFRTIPANQ